MCGRNVCWQWNLLVTIAAFQSVSTVHLKTIRIKLHLDTMSDRSVATSYLGTLTFQEDQAAWMCVHITAMILLPTIVLIQTFICKRKSFQSLIGVLITIIDSLQTNIRKKLH